MEMCIVIYNKMMTVSCLPGLRATRFVRWKLREGFLEFQPNRTRSALGPAHQSPLKKVTRGSANEPQISQAAVLQQITLSSEAATCSEHFNSCWQLFRLLQFKNCIASASIVQQTLRQRFDVGSIDLAGLVSQSPSNPLHQKLRDEGRLREHRDRK